MTLAAALGLHESDCPDLAAMRGCGRLRGAMVAAGVGFPLASGVALAVLMLFALLLQRTRTVGVMLSRRRRGAPITAVLTGRDRHPDELLDVAQERPLLRVTERDRG